MSRPNPMPRAAVAVMAAAIEDYRMNVGADVRTPEQMAEHVAVYLLSEGYALRPASVRDMLPPRDDAAARREVLAAAVHTRRAPRAA